MFEKTFITSVKIDVTTSCALARRKWLSLSNSLINYSMLGLMLTMLVKGTSVTTPVSKTVRYMWLISCLLNISVKIKTNCMPETSENWLGHGNSCVYSARQTHEIYQILSYSVFRIVQPWFWNWDDWDVFSSWVCLFHRAKLYTDAHLRRIGLFLHVFRTQDMIFG